MSAGRERSQGECNLPREIAAAYPVQTGSHITILVIYIISYRLGLPLKPAAAASRLFLRRSPSAEPPSPATRSTARWPAIAGAKLPVQNLHAGKNRAQNRCVDDSAAALVKVPDAEQGSKTRGSRSGNGTRKNALKCRENKSAIEKFLAQTHGTNQRHKRQSLRRDSAASTSARSPGAVRDAPAEHGQAGETRRNCTSARAERAPRPTPIGVARCASATPRLAKLHPRATHRHAVSAGQHPLEGDRRSVDRDSLRGKSAQERPAARAREPRRATAPRRRVTPEWRQDPKEEEMHGFQMKHQLSMRRKRVPT